MKDATYIQKALGIQRSEEGYPPVSCQPLNEVWEGVNPDSTPSTHSGTLHTPELPWVGPAFLPGAQSLLQAMTQHFYYSGTIGVSYG